MRRSESSRYSVSESATNFKIEFFVVRVGDWGGHLLVDCDDPLMVHKFCSMLPAFTMEARAVIPSWTQSRPSSK